ncbi:MAG: excalibur calcium-binding domain-containing protein [Pseudomonadota bacterium]
MKIRLLGIILVALAVFGYQRVVHRAPAEHAAYREEDTRIEFATPPPGADPAAEGDGARFQCDGRVYCSQMNSCEEATWVLRNCPGVKMDGDSDGVPCETQWCR